MSALRVELLGPTRIFFGGVPYAYRAPPRCLPLLGYLLHRRRTALARESLAYAMWPDDTERDARANLRRHLHRLTQALPKSTLPWIVADTITVGWNPDASTDVDVEEFEAASVGDEGAVERALRLYRGEYLEGVYDDWVFPERERLRARQIENYNQLIHRARGDRAFDRAAGLAKELLALEPWREHTLRTLMAARQASGDRAGAIDAYETFARRLASEMATEPMPETVAAYEAVLRDAVLEPARFDDADRRPHQAAALPFGGRARELERLAVPWGRSARGQGSVLFVGGEAGVGKTRLLQEFGAIAAEQGALVVFGSTTQPETRPYQAIVEALRSALPILLGSSLAPIQLSVLSRVLPEIRARRPEIADAPAVEPGRERARLFEAFAAALTALSTPRPLLAILEDVHWAGAATLDLIASIANAVTGNACLVAATYRDEDVGRTHGLRTIRRALEREGQAMHLALGRLEAGAIREIGAKCFGAEADPDLIDRLFQQSEGNPLFLSQAVRNALDGSGAAASSDADSAIATNIARLSPAAIATAQSAAILGRAFDVEALAEVGGWNEHDVLNALDELLDRTVVREASAAHRRDYAFSHHLVQAYVYGTIDEHRKRREHRRAALVLREIAEPSGASFGAIALHFEQGGESVEAAAAYLRAAAYDASVFANLEALEYASRAAALDSNTAFESAALREELHGRIGMRDEQRADIAAMVAALSGEATSEDAIDTRFRTVRFLHAIGERDAERVSVCEFEGLAATSGAKWRGEAALARASLDMADGNLASALASAMAAVGAFREASSARVVVARCLAAEIHAARSAFVDAMAALGEARREAEEADDALLLARCYQSAGVVEFSRSNFVAARANGLALLAVCERIGDKQGAAHAHLRVATSSVRRFDFADARGHYGEAARLFARVRDTQGEAIVLLNSATMRCSIGDIEGSLADLTRAYRLFLGLGDRRGQALSLGNRSYVLRRAGRTEEALETGLAGLEVATELGSPAVEAHVRGNIGAAQRDLGRIDESIHNLRIALEARRSTASGPDFVEDAADYALALLAAGRIAEARDVVTEIETHAERAETALFPQDAWWIAARVHAMAGETEAYSRALRKADAALQARLQHLTDPADAARYARMHYNAAIAAEAASEPGGRVFPATPNP